MVNKIMIDTNVLLDYSIDYAVVLKKYLAGIKDSEINLTYTK